MLHFGPAGDADLPAILALQQINLPKNVSAEEAREQGFVTVEHDLPLLTAMNSPYPHSIARDGDVLAGYALVMLPDFRRRVPVLIPLFELIDGIVWRGRPLAQWRYFVMGQVCVAKAYRGQGVFPGLYHNLRDRLHPHFDVVVTEVAARNTRSLRAHEKVGFENLHEYSVPGEDWVIVGWGL